MQHPPEVPGLPRKCPACRKSGTMVTFFVPTKENGQCPPQIFCSAKCGWGGKVRGYSDDEIRASGIPTRTLMPDGSLPSKGSPP